MNANSITTVRIENTSNPLRPIEKRMLEGTSYEHGRIGAEIAHGIGKKRLGLANLTLNEPSLGGIDLLWIDAGVSIQARMLYLRSSRQAKTRTLRREIKSLIRKLHEDFRWNENLLSGFAILTTFTDSEGLKSCVIETRP